MLVHNYQISVKKFRYQFHCGVSRLLSGKTKRSLEQAKKTSCTTISAPQKIHSSVKQISNVLFTILMLYQGITVKKY